MAGPHFKSAIKGTQDLDGGGMRVIRGMPQGKDNGIYSELMGHVDSINSTRADTPEKTYALRRALFEMAPESVEITKNIHYAKRWNDEKAEIYYVLA